MRRDTLLLLALSVLVLTGCQDKNQQATARHEEPYTPTYTSLDAMEAAPASDPVAPAEPVADAGTLEPADDASDEQLVPVGGRVYMVQKGDTLYKLARRFYNDQARWRDIWDANKNRLSDPNKLPLGMKLIIP